MNDLSFYQAIYENNPNIILIINFETRQIVNANPAACMFYQYSLTELTSLNLTDINILPEDIIKDEMKKVQKGKCKSFYCTHKMKNGELRTVEVNSTILTISEVEYLYSIIYDSKEKSTHQLLVMGLFYETPSAMIIMDQDLHVVALNKGFTNLFGYHLNDFDEQLFTGVFSKQEDVDININLDRVLKGEVVNKDSIRYTKSGETIEVNITGTPYYYNNLIAGVLIVYQDIREQVNYQNELEAFRQATLTQLIQNKERLQLILNSTVEGIIGIDFNGLITFCNKSAYKMLRYHHEDELLGKSFYEINRESSIKQSIKEGTSTHNEDEVFYRSDNTSFNVSYHTHPKIKDNEPIGAVITFTDITRRKKREERVQYLSSHDVLTGLYNRAYFDELVKRIDTADNLPISIIYGDINGLKLTNDIFGHQAGDLLLKQSATILKECSNENALIARVGGDEFIILLPKTSSDKAKARIEGIKECFLNFQIEAVHSSIAMGYETKETADENINQIISEAETWMYKDKMVNLKAVNEQMIAKIVTTLHERNPRDKVHAENVSLIAKMIAIELGLSEPEIKRISSAGFLHDIGKIVLASDITKTNINTNELVKMKQHAIVGFRILNLFTETMDIAESVLYHHEHFDGTGFPKGLKADEIPLFSRIIAVAEAYDNYTNEFAKNILSPNQALSLMDSLAGSKFDLKIVKLLHQVIKNNKLSS